MSGCPEDWPSPPKLPDGLELVGEGSMQAESGGRFLLRQEVVSWLKMMAEAWESSIEGLAAPIDRIGRRLQVATLNGLAADLEGIEPSLTEAAAEMVRRSR